MEIIDLQKLALRTRFMREAGTALLVASGILAIFLFLSPPSTHHEPAKPAISIATTTAPDPFTAVPIEAQAAIVYDLATGETFYAKNADAQLPLASLTKLLTVYAAVAELPLSARITIPADATKLTPPRAFSVGQAFTLADLSRLTLTASLNDGAAAIASATAVYEHQTQERMFAAAASALDLAQTYAVNGSGLDVSASVSGGYGSARDLARLAGALVSRAPSVAEATTRPSAQAISEGGTRFSVKNTDPMVGAIPNLLLSKTGYTDLAGGNLALVFDAGIGHPIAIVVLGSSQKARFTDGTALIAAAFAHFAQSSLL